MSWVQPCLQEGIFELARRAPAHMMLLKIWNWWTQHPLPSKLAVNCQIPLCSTLHDSASWRKVISVARMPSPASRGMAFREARDSSSKNQQEKSYHLHCSPTPKRATKAFMSALKLSSQRQCNLCVVRKWENTMLSSGHCTGRPPRLHATCSLSMPPRWGGAEAASASS